MSKELEQQVNDLLTKASQNVLIIPTPQEEKNKSKYIGEFSVIHQKQIIATFQDIEDAKEFRNFKLRQIIDYGDDYEK